MKTLIPCLTLATASLTVGLLAFSSNSAQAATWTRTITAFEDNTSDTRSPNTNFGSSTFLSVGRSPTNTNSSNQSSWIGFDLQSIIDEVKAISDSAFITNVTAQLILTQTNTNTSNPNNPTGTRQSPNFTRVSFNAFQVTGEFSESQAINPSSPPATSSTLLFSGQIAQGNNIYQSATLNNTLSSLLTTLLTTNNLDPLNPQDSDFALTLRPTTSQNIPAFGIYPIDDFFSQNASNPASRPKIVLKYDVYAEATDVSGGVDVKTQVRGGGNNTWESAFLTVPPTGPDVIQSPQGQWTWTNGQYANFQLSCDPTTDIATFVLSNTTNFTNPQISYSGSSCDDGFDGLRIFSSAQYRANSVDPGASMEIIVDRVSPIGSSSFVNVSGLSAKATVPGVSQSQLVQDLAVFTNPISQGGLGFTQGADVVQGRIALSWPGNNPQTTIPSAESRLQIQMIPLTQVLPPSNPGVPNGSLPPSNSPGNNSPQSVPEPSSAISFLVLGALGIRLKSRKNP